MLALLAIPASITAHEYWLDPIDYFLNTEQELIADARNGQNFSGSAFPYVPEEFANAIIVSPDDRQIYEGRVGDYPAFHYKPDIAGLWSLAIETTRSNLVYPNWEKFQTFLDYHGLKDIASRHSARGLPRSDIREHYYRFVKTFFVVRGTDGQLEDAINHPSKAFARVETRLELELLTNPYANLNTVKARLLYLGKPLANRQVELFQKNSNVERVTSESDSDGVVSFDISQSGEYMLNAVHVIESGEPDIHWESLWASLTFGRN